MANTHTCAHTNLLKVYSGVLDAKDGFVNSRDCTIHSMDPGLAQQSMKCLFNSYIVQNESPKLWTCRNHGLPLATYRV